MKELFGGKLREMIEEAMAEFSEHLVARERGAYICGEELKPRKAFLGQVGIGIPDAVWPERCEPALGVFHVHPTPFEHDASVVFPSGDDIGYAIKDIPGGFVCIGYFVRHRPRMSCVRLPAEREKALELLREYEPVRDQLSWSAEQYGRYRELARSALMVKDYERYEKYNMEALKHREIVIRTFKQCADILRRYAAEYCELGL